MSPGSSAGVNWRLFAFSVSVTSFFSFHRSLTHQEQAKTRTGGSILTPTSGDSPHTPFTQDSLPSRRVLGTSNALAASQLCWADCGAGFPVQGGEPQLIIALVSRLFSSVFVFCNLNSKLIQLRCLGIKQQL